MTMCGKYGKKVMTIWGACLILVASATAAMNLPPMPQSMDEVRLIAFHMATEEGYKHKSAFKKAKNLFNHLGDSLGFHVTTAEGMDWIHKDTLKNYHVVVWSNMARAETMDTEKQEALEAFVEAGGGYVGFHSSGDIGKYDKWPWYFDMLGSGDFDGHSSSSAEGKIIVEEPASNFPSLTGFETGFEIKDEHYNFTKNPRDVADIKVVWSYDEASIYGDKDNFVAKDHPMVWYREYKGGRCFYAAYGHNESWERSELSALSIASITYAAGLMDSVPSSAHRRMPGFTGDCTHGCKYSHGYESDEPMLILDSKGRVMHSGRGDELREKLGKNYPFSGWYLVPDSRQNLDVKLQ